MRAFLALEYCLDNSPALQHMIVDRSLPGGRRSREGLRCASLVLRVVWVSGIGGGIGGGALLEG